MILPKAKIMKMNVGTKIGLGFGLALAMLTVLGVMSYQTASELTEAMREVNDTHRMFEQQFQLMEALAEAESAQRGYIMTADPNYLSQHQAAAAAVEERRTALEALIQDGEQRARLDQLEPLLQERIRTLEAGIAARREGGAEAGLNWVGSGTGQTQMAGIRQKMRQIEETAAALLNRRAEKADARAQGTKFAIVAGTVLAFLILGLAGVVITRNIANPLREISSVAERIAQGDLNVPVSRTSRSDEVGVVANTFASMTEWLQMMAAAAGRIATGDLRVKVEPQSEKDLLGSAFASMMANLQRLTVQIQEGISVLGSSAAQISTSTSQLAAGATQTATAVSETTTTVEEVRQAAEVSSQKARGVSDTAQKVAQISEKGKKATEESLEGMKRIREQMDAMARSMAGLSEQTQAIGRIIATVEEIASQSNLLAVNAAIEAAKAGEQGRGFSVVAQEVKSLAEQSKEATKQVRTILNDIQRAATTAVLATEQGSKAVEDGVKKSAEAGETIQVLAGGVGTAAQAAAQIAASSQQQLVGMDQVASAMESINQASVQNVTSARQLENAAHNLKDLGENLKRLVEQYQV